MSLFFGWCLESRKAKKKKTAFKDEETIVVPSREKATTASGDGAGRDEYREFREDLRESTRSSVPASQAPVDAVDIISSWRVASDDEHVTLMHASTGTVIELVGRSNGWLQCRDSKWQMYTLHPDGSIEVPPLQVLDAEHLITEIRHQEPLGGCRIRRHGMRIGRWSLKLSEHGHVMVTHEMHRDQILILMTIGFCFVGNSGDAVLVEEDGVHKMSKDEAEAILRR